MVRGIKRAADGAEPSTALTRKVASLVAENILTEDAASVQSTERLECCIDYLEYTAPCDDTALVIHKALIGMTGEAITLKKSGNYSHAEMEGARRIAWGGEQTRLRTGAAAGSESLHVVISGQGCRELEGTIIGQVDGEQGRYDWYSYLETLVNVGAVITRLDVAGDYHGTEMTMDRVNEYLNTQRVRSRFRVGQRAQKFDLHEPQDAQGGETIHLGTIKSDTSVCIYDKKAEREAKGEKQEDRPWLRVELRAKRKRAHALAQHIIASRSVQKVVAVIRSCVDFIEYDGDSNLSRCPIAEWWATITENTDVTKLVLGQVQKTYRRMAGWLRQSVISSIAVFIDGLGGKKDPTSMIVFERMLDEARRRYAKRHQRLIDDCDDRTRNEIVREYIPAVIPI